MKNSNKILLITLLGFFALFLAIALLTRSDNEITTSNENANVVNNALTSKTCQLNDFSALNVHSSSNIEIKSGDKNELVVTGTANVLQNLDVHVDNEVLYITDKNHIPFDNNNFNISIVTKNPIAVITANGANQIMATSATTDDDLKLTFRGSSNVEIQGINSQQIELAADGANQISFAGKVNNLKINSQGTNHIETKNLTANYVSVESSGASHIVVYVKKYLNVDASGLARIQYLGNPQKINNTSSGFTKVEVYDGNNE